MPCCACQPGQAHKEQQRVGDLERKAALVEAARELRRQMSDSQISSFRAEIKNR
jgi:hypothetical protein